MADFRSIADVMKNAWAGAATTYDVNVLIDEDDCLLASLARSDVYALMQATTSPFPGRVLVDVHAGAAHGVAATPKVMEILATSSWRSDYGGVWCRTAPMPASVAPGTLNFGWRGRWPSELIAATDAAAPTRAGDPAAWPALMGGLLPPQ